MSSYKDSLSISFKEVFPEGVGHLFGSDGEDPEVEEVMELQPPNTGSELMDPSQLVGAMEESSQGSVRADLSPSSSISS